MESAKCRRDLSNPQVRSAPPITRNRSGPPLSKSSRLGTHGIANPMHWREGLKREDAWFAATPSSRPIARISSGDGAPPLLEGSGRRSTVTECRATPAFPFARPCRRTPGVTEARHKRRRDLQDNGGLTPGRPSMLAPDVQHPGPADAPFARPRCAAQVGLDGTSKGVALQWVSCDGLVHPSQLAQGECGASLHFE